ncbi:inactive ubiquitin carboxyl-terminal hydrolase MINDY-4B isoform X2 [Gallus gallus]|uniref:inactive ubiquitin carboxyl-terminal hydrolase MINDY-4B isoform X2 n=1 Tax=Gallus gallus TaxID=9031 RepID=UPI001AE22833|nr:inactive ubiquitin carboxyl-terminal hydrolase MINDY-4B isoform X2 [Gallus gallus]
MQCTLRTPEQAMHAAHAEHTAPQTALGEISSRISDLDKWRKIFSFCGREGSQTAPQGPAGCGHGAVGTRGAAEPRVPPAEAQQAGRPIPMDMATALRTLLLGNASRTFSQDWAGAYFRFREPRSDLAYALEAEKGGTRAIVMAVQANIIKYLLFMKNTEHTHLERLCKISQKEQGEALAAALADSLWAAGDGRRATVCLLTAATHCSPPAGYKADSFTERIHLFEFPEKAAAQEFIFDHIGCFRDEGSHGLILFLYSLLFSRTLERVQEELCAATPHLLECSSGNVSCTQVGSMLKTPKFPIWLCSINGTHSVLFGTNQLLLSDWKMEHVFHLYFYNGQHKQTRTAHLTIGVCPTPPGHCAVGITYRCVQDCLCAQLCTSSPSHSPCCTHTLMRTYSTHLYFPTQEQSAPRHPHSPGAPHTFRTVLHFQIPTHITGKRAAVRLRAARGGGLRHWRWPSGPSGPGRPSGGTAHSPSSELPPTTAPPPAPGAGPSLAPPQPSAGAGRGKETAWQRGHFLPGRDVQEIKVCHESADHSERLSNIKC